MIFWGYVLNGPVVWSLYGVGMYAAKGKLSLLERRHHPLPNPAPSVTILIPAKDEGEPLRDCLSSALSQDYPNFRVLAINDRSGDNTGAIMDEMSANDSRLRVLHIAHGSVPQGWTGKNNALFTAVKQTESDWFLFVDSDVILQPPALSRVMAYATSRNYSFLSLLLRLECHTFWETLIMPLSGAGVLGLYTVGLANMSSLPNVAFANGQFILCHRDAYTKFGTHEAVKSAFSEDVEIAKLAKSRGLEPRIAWGVDLAAVRMYSSLPRLIKGWGRNFFGCGRGSPWRIITGILFILFSCYSVYAAIGFSIWRITQGNSTFWSIGWSSAAAVHFALMTFFLGKTYEWSGNVKRNALLFPLGGALMLWIFAVALKLCLTKKVEWRGDQYAGAKPQAA